MFTPLYMGTNHMLGVDSYVPLVTNNFEIRIYNMDGSSPTENSDLLTLSTAEIGNVEESEDIITVHYGNGLIKFPAKVNFADVGHTASRPASISAKTVETFEDGTTRTITTSTSIRVTSRTTGCS